MRSSISRVRGEQSAFSLEFLLRSASALQELRRGPSGGVARPCWRGRCPSGPTPALPCGRSPASTTSFILPMNSAENLLPPLPLADTARSAAASFLMVAMVCFSVTCNQLVAEHAGQLRLVLDINASAPFVMWTKPPGAANAFTASVSSTMNVHGRFGRVLVVDEHGADERHVLRAPPRPARRRSAARIFVAHLLSELDLLGLGDAPGRWPSRELGAPCQACP